MDSRQGRPAEGGRPRRLRLLLAAGALVAALSVAVPTALAIHEFTDVPDSNPFHDDISAIRGAGITAGKTCVPPGSGPTFCPEEGVTRQAMAAFLHRGLSRTGITNGPQMQVFGEVDLAVVTVDVGGVPGESQFVKLDGAVATCDSCGLVVDVCPCVTSFYIWQDGVGVISIPGRNTNLEGDVQSGAVTAAVSVPSGTTQIFRLRANQGDVSIGAAWGSLSFITAPFGAGG